MLVYNCSELSRNGRNIKQTNFGNYTWLHPEGKNLIRGWFERARAVSNRAERFEPFIYAWFAFNSWASCVVNTDIDAEFIEALSADARMHRDFATLIDDPKSPLSIHARVFAEMLPIFDVKKMRQKGIQPRYDNRGSRADRIAYYLSRGAEAFEPKCWQRHVNSGEVLALDWAHILKAIYKVRCNLFHGQKSAHSEMDNQIVSAAFFTLVSFIDETGYLR